MRRLCSWPGQIGEVFPAAPAGRVAVLGAQVAVLGAQVAVLGAQVAVLGAQVAELAGRAPGSSRAARVFISANN